MNVGLWGADNMCMMHHSDSSICIRFTSSVEGIRGDQLSITELRDLAKMEAPTRHQVVGVQILVGAKFGYRKKPSQKTILYKTEYQRESIAQ